MLVSYLLGSDEGSIDLFIPIQLEASDFRGIFVEIKTLFLHLPDAV